MNNPSAFGEYKNWLVEELQEKSQWCGQVSNLFGDDSRSLRCSDTLKILADVVRTLPETHPLFGKLAQIGHLDAVTRERWLDEVRLEFANIGWLSQLGPDDSIRRLFDITDASLREWQRANRSS
jgi:hypothetical protein